MADLAGRNRGQIILIAAFALAVIFLTLALVVNSAIFTENLASRSDTTGSGDALAERAVVAANVGDAIEAANRNNYSSDSELQTAVENSIIAYQSESGPRQAASGQLTDVRYLSLETGERITYTGGSTFDGPGTEYNLAEDIDRTPNGNGTRAFVINATSMPSSRSAAFNISVVGPNGARWTTEIWEGDDGAGTDYVNISTERVDLTGAVVADYECGISEGSTNAPLIAITDGTINGRPCAALGTTGSGENLHFGAGTDAEYDIRFENANNIAGNYTLVVFDGGTSPTITTAGTARNALYQVTVRYDYETTNIEYTTEIRVAPGEPDA